MAASRFRPLLAGIREAYGGSVALLLARDRSVLAADGNGWDDADWRALLAEIDRRWPTWDAFARLDGFRCPRGTMVIADWIDEEAVFVVEMGPEHTLGLGRLRAKRHVESLERALRASVR